MCHSRVPFETQPATVSLPARAVVTLRPLHAEIHTHAIVYGIGSPHSASVVDKNDHVTLKGPKLRP